MLNQWKHELLDNAAGYFKGSESGTTGRGLIKDWTMCHQMRCTSLNH